MFIKRQMPITLIFRWTSKTTYIFLINAVVATALHGGLGFTWLTVPWTLVALVGTAVAFLIGFQNNAAYDRVWEARKIWGGIVNATRTFSVFSRDMIHSDPGTLKIILHRHRAWLTALRYALRDQKPWEIPQVTPRKSKPSIA